MSTKLKFIWIDDTSDRELDAKNMKVALKTSMVFYNAQVEPLDDILKKIKDRSRPDLIIIDHNLEDINLKLFKKGSTLAAYFRSEWPNLPIVCITAVSLNEVDHQQKSQYDEIFEATRIAEKYDTILSIAKSFKSFNEKSPTNVTGLIDLLRPPVFDRERLISVLPKDLKSKFNDPSLVLELSNWVRKSLMARPGFLYDKLWACTYLGIKPQSFKKIENLIGPAKYKGIFADNSNERWWKSELLTILSKKVKGTDLPWKKGRSLSNITSKDYSKSHISGDPFPDTVAYADETENSPRYPMKMRETIHHPKFEDLLFFEEIRLQKPYDD